MKHTELPWEYNQETEIYGNYEIKQEEWGGIASVYNHAEYMDEGKPAELADKEAEANAQYIVKACNLFPELISALKDISRIAENNGDSQIKHFALNMIEKAERE
jgi:hypothetical protein